MPKPDLHTVVPSRRLRLPESHLRDSGERLRRLEETVRLANAQKRALHATAHQAGEGAKRLADLAGISYQFLCNAALESTKDQLPFARLPLVLRHSDDLTLLRFYARLQGCDVIRLPRATGNAEDLHRASATMREFAEFMDKSADALTDGEIQPDEFAAIEREGLEAVRAICESIAHHRARVRRPLLDEVR